MNLTDLNRLSSAYPDRKRRGRGHGSGLGKTSGRGHKGAGARSGASYRPGFEGGQMPLFRRIPKRGFTNAPFRKRFDIINLDLLDSAAVLSGDGVVSLQFLVDHHFIRPRHGRLKVLARGELRHKVVVEAAHFSAEARRKIEDQGGQAKQVS